LGCAVIHCNSSLAHQVKIAQALRDGFTLNGQPSRIVNTPHGDGDFHVVMGPWFAKYSDCLYIDRAYWGDPECVSVHWMRGGEKVRPEWESKRPHPELKPMKSGDRTVYLCDYRQKPSANYHNVRYHPAERPSRYTLTECLERHDVAVGRRTTALVEAHINGLKVITDDPHSPVYGITDRERWINNLAWHNWSLREIAEGEMWTHFKLHGPRQTS
jgi:hypothetical protein